MFNLLKKIYYYIESLRGVSLFVFVSVSFLLFLSIGLLFGYFTDPKLNQPEIEEMHYGERKPISKAEIGKMTIDGKIQYTNPDLYPGDDISYILIGDNGEEIILLKAEDELLSVVETFEGLSVTVEGTKTRAKSSGREVLVVDKVTFRNNGAN